MSLHSSIPLAKTDSTTYRRLMVSRFDPPLQTLVTERRKCLTCHRPSHQLRLQSLLLMDYQQASLHLSKILFCSQPGFGRLYETWPVVLFSPGLEHHSSPILHASTRNCKSGLTVITLDRPFDTDIVEFPDGSNAYGDNVKFSDINSVYQALDVRMDDISFMLKILGLNTMQLQTRRTLTFGHFGRELLLLRGCSITLDFVAV
jgi:hypothetical protein